MNTSIPLVADIKRHSLEDGPGIRSVVFLKGCPLKCVFCQNPETWRPEQEIAFFPLDCVQCGECVKACPALAVDLSLPGAIRREACNACGKCVDACPGGGLRRIGKFYDLNELLEILLRDMTYYRCSEGGVTFSGGECTMHAAFMRPALKRLKSQNINIVVQTSGFFDYDLFRRMVLPYVDLIHFDIKFTDPFKHRHYTGRSNQRIIGNFLRLLKDRPDAVLVRTPLIPGITATPENLRQLAEFLVESNVRKVELLPYNPMGISKFASLGLPAPDIPTGFMKPREEAEIYQQVGRTLGELIVLKSPNNQLFEEVSPS